MGNKLSSFASLRWYDACINFLFALAAKSSEPLLAVGIVYSAADVLSHGHIGYGNQSIQNVWSITQALAIESSGGVVLVYGLQSLMERDYIKAWCYLPLSFLLALVGGVMLYMQMAGLDAIGSAMLWLFALRCVVSISYIYLMRAKHIRFSGLHLQQDAIVNNINDSTLARDDVNSILAALAELQDLRVQVTQLTQQQHALNGPEKLVRGDVQDESSIDTTVELPPVETLQKPCMGKTSEQSYADKIEELYKDNPGITIPEIVQKLGCSTRTAAKWLQRLRPAE